jgi:hypothetical protein
MEDVFPQFEAPAAPEGEVAPAEDLEEGEITLEESGIKLDEVADKPKGKIFETWVCASCSSSHLVAKTVGALPSTTQQSLTLRCLVYAPLPRVQQRLLPLWRLVQVHPRRWVSQAPLAPPAMCRHRFESPHIYFFFSACRRKRSEANQLTEHRERLNETCSKHDRCDRTLWRAERLLL